MAENTNHIVGQSLLPVIYTPDGGEVRGEAVWVSGLGLGGFTDVYERLPDGSHRHCGFSIAGIFWHARCTFPQNGQKTLVARYLGDTAFGPPVVFTYVYEKFAHPAPVISGPSMGAFVETVVNITGTGIHQALFAVYLDLTNEKLGSGWVGYEGFEPMPDPTSWKKQVILPPGPVTLTAIQDYWGGSSERSAPLTLRVRPSVPTITSTLNGGTVTLSGTGHNGTNVQMHIHRAFTAVHLFDAPITSGRWTKVIPEDFVPGNHVFSGKQSLSDGGSGRIHSGRWADNLAVNIPTPIPTGVTVTVTGQRPTFSGRGRQWGTNAVKVGLFSNGTALAGVPQANVQTNLNWTTTATADLPPGYYTALTARQLVNGQWSADSAKITMTVASPVPVFTEPPTDTPTGQRPRIRGTAWRGSSVTLKIPGKPDVPLTATNGTFELSATEDWAPGTYTLTATAAFGGQTSAVASRTFTVKTPLPVITTAANAEVDLSPVIQGTGFKNCWVVVYSSVTHQSIGAGPVGQDGKWSVTLSNQVPGNLTFYAVQQAAENSSNVSDRTAVRTVKVRVPKPVVTVPAQNGRPARTSLFSGTGQYPGTVELSIKGQTPPFLKDIDIQSDGTWQVTVTLAVGAVTLEARLRQRNYASDPLERSITVVPGVPVVDTPLDGEAMGKLLRISGFGVPGDNIKVYRRGDRWGLLGYTSVMPSGTWSMSLPHNLIEADLGISALAQLSGQDSENSDIRQFKLLGPAPQITEPLAADWGGSRPRFAGLATPGATVTVASWFNTDNVLAPATTADAQGRWAVMGNKDLPVGAARVMMRQTVSGKPSEWVESGRFMVERKAAGFEAPTVHFPLAGQTVGRYPMFSGTGEPGAEILIVKENSMTTELGRTLVDRDGRWALRSKIQLPVSATAYVYSVRQSRDGAVSQWSLPNRNVVVTQVADNFEKPVIDVPADNAAQVLERRPVFAGTGMPGAELKVYRHGTSEVLATVLVDAQGRWTTRCAVELTVQTAAHQVSARQTLDGQQSAMSSSVGFKVSEVVERPVFTSPSTDAIVSPHAVFYGTALPGAEVHLHESEDAQRVWGRGTADEQGLWIVVTDPLPLGAFRMGGRALKGGKYSSWMSELTLTVSDVG